MKTSSTIKDVESVTIERVDLGDGDDYVKVHIEGWFGSCMTLSLLGTLGHVVGPRVKVITKGDVTDVAG